MTRKERAAQHSPMYLYDFLQKLAPLRAAQIPEMESLRPNEVAYAWGDRKTAEKYTKDLPEKGEYFLLYAKKEALLTLYSRDVTPQAKYLDSLKTELLVPQEDGDSDLLELGKAYLQRLREEYVRCSLIALPELPEEAARAQAMELSAQGLMTHTRALRKAASRRMPVLSQLLGDLPSDPAPASDPDSVNRPFRLERSTQN